MSTSTNSTDLSSGRRPDHDDVNRSEVLTFVALHFTAPVPKESIHGGLFDYTYIIQLYTETESLYTTIHYTYMAAFLKSLYFLYVYYIFKEMPSPSDFLPATQNLQAAASGTLPGVRLRRTCVPQPRRCHSCRLSAQHVTLPRRSGSNSYCNG